MHLRDNFKAQRRIEEHSAWLGTRLGQGGLLRVVGLGRQKKCEVWDRREGTEVFGGHSSGRDRHGWGLGCYKGGGRDQWA